MEVITETQPTSESICMNCGACCARFDVSFYSEDLSLEKYSYSSGLFQRTMKTRIDSKGRPRCVALRGELGCSVSCGIYDQRPTPCREFNDQDPRCEQARKAIGL